MWPLLLYLLLSKMQSEQEGQEYEGGPVETFLVFEILLRLEL
jgi:hypothetical protein